MGGIRRVYVAGSTGMVGRVLTKALLAKGYEVVDVQETKSDLRDQQQAFHVVEHLEPDCIILLAARVGGIYANMMFPAEFIYDNLMIQSNVIHAAKKYGVKRLVFTASSCVYPRNCPQPMKEDYLLTGPLEPTNEAYAIAKLAGLKMIQAYNKQYGTAYIGLLPPNLYGPGDNFDVKNSHVISGLMRRMHEAKIQSKEAVDVWGTGKPKREFLFVEDLSDACVFLLEHYPSTELINVGAGREITIKELAFLIKDTVDYRGRIVFDESKPDGMPAKLLDTTKMKELGWEAKTPLRTGLMKMYNYYLEQYDSK